MNKKKNTKQRPWGVFAAIILAIIVGSWSGENGQILGVKLYPVLDVLGKIFLNALILVVVPLVFSSVVTGIARVGSDESFKRLGTKIFLFYIGTILLSILTGLFFVNLLAPGLVESIQLPERVEEIGSLKTIDGGLHSLVGVLISIVPSNILRALSNGEMLPLIFFALIFGYCISKIDGKQKDTLIDFFNGVFNAMIRFTRIIMKFLPYGVFCLVAKVFMTSGIASLHSMSLFLLAVLLGLGTFMFVALPILLKIVAKVDPIRHFKAMGPALITAFSTSSSSATLPITMECVEKRANVSHRICSLVVPLGTSVNMSGSALYECVAAMFVAQAYGMDLSFGTQFLIVLLALITSMGVAGIPSASLVAVIIILKAIGLPTEGIGLFIAVDRILDMCRTTVNVFSDSCCAVLVAKSEGEKNVLQSEA